LISTALTAQLAAEPNAAASPTKYALLCYEYIS
jgi:hypothetical protein